MDAVIFGLTPLAVAVVLLFVALRSHERYWTLGFLGWRKVYAGLILYLLSGLATAGWHWAYVADPAAMGRLLLWQVSASFSAAVGMGLVLAGAIERLRELSAERERLDDVRAGFDLFDTLRDIAAQPYAFLEVLDFSLKEMVRAAGADYGGLWLYNPGKGEWVLTGWANMSEKLRQQTESVRGTGTGFDRLSVAHKARLFTGPEEIRLFFPEWEAEGVQSILGLPLTSGAIGSPGRQVLGAIILADRSGLRFDDDRARRLYAASDYVAAVIAEARITRQLEAARQQLDSTHAEWERDREDVRRQQEASERRFVEQMAAWSEERKSLEVTLSQRLADTEAKAREEVERARIDFETRAAVLAAAEKERVGQLQERLEEARRNLDMAERRLENERTDGGRRLDQFQRDRQTELEEARRREEHLVATHNEELSRAQGHIEKLQAQLQQAEENVRQREQALVSAQQTVAGLESLIETERQRHETMVAELTVQIDTGRREAQRDRQYLEQELHATRLQLDEREKQMSAHLAAARQAAAEADAHHHGVLEAERQSATEAIAHLERELQDARADRESVVRELQASRLTLSERERQFAAQLDTEQSAAAEAEAHLQGILATERRQAQETVQRLEDDALTQRQGLQALEDELHVVRAERAAFEEQTHRERVEERLNLRRELNIFETRYGAILDGVRNVLALTPGFRQQNELLHALARNLPGRVELYLWKRDGDANDRLLVWMDADGIASTCADLSPWSFEVQTIPAEGATRLTGPERWAEVEALHSQEHVWRWRAHWGEKRQPVWAISWPWSRSAQNETGWITAFGFDESPVVTDEQVDDVARWVGLLAAVIADTEVQTDSASGPYESAGTPGTEGQTGDAPTGGSPFAVVPATAVETPVTDPRGSDSAPPAPVEDFAFGMEPDSDIPTELNHVILNWAATQTEDALRLDLSARSDMPVEGPWLLRVLEHGRHMCRATDPSANEFAVSTRSDSGHTILRLVRSGEAPPPTDMELAAVGDTIFTDHDAPHSRSAMAIRPAALFPVIARWLTRDGDRLGLELLFDDPSQVEDPVFGKSTPGRDVRPVRSENPAQPLEVLVFDYARSVGDLIVGMLESLGHKAWLTDEEDDAQLHAVDHYIDLAIINTTAPEDMGWQLAGWLREEAGSVPIVILSDDRADDLSDDPRCDHLLQIPFPIDELRDCLARLTASAAYQSPPE